eukprot:gene6426-7085_t
MSEMVVKWTSGGKRLHAEVDGAERKVRSIVTREPDIARDSQSLEKARGDHRSHIIKQVYWFRNALDQVKVKLEERAVGGYHEKQAKVALQHLLENFENRLSSFKLSMRGEFDRLEVEEAVLTREIEGLDLLCYEEDAGPTMEDGNEDREEAEAEAAVEKANKMKAALRVEEDLAHKAAIGEVERELAALGRFGGWDARDHDAFVRVWNSTLAGAMILHKVLHSEEKAEEMNVEEKNHHGAEDEEDGEQPETNERERTQPSHGDGQIEFVVNLSNFQRSQLLKKLEFQVLGKSSDELNDHVEWYSRVLALTAKKKQLVADWRKQAVQRRRSWAEKVASEEIEEEEVKGTNAVVDEEQLAKEESRIRRLEEQRVLAQQRAAKWRADKKLQEERLKAEKQQQEERELKAAQAERKRRQSELQVQLAVWKENEAATKPRASSETASPRKTDPTELKRRQERNMELAKQRKEKFVVQAQKKNERDRRLSDLLNNAPEPVVERDPARLLNATKASEAQRVYSEDLDAADRRRSTGGAHSSVVPMSGRDLQFAGRTKPVWMRPPK